MSILFNHMSKFPAMALSAHPSESQLKLLKALVYVYPGVCQKEKFAELTGFSGNHVHNLMRSLMEKEWAFRYDRPDHNRYYHFPNVARIADALELPPADEIRVVLADEKNEFIRNIKADLADLDQRKLEREAAAKAAAEARAERQAAQDAQAKANAAEFERLTSQVAAAVECAEPAAGPVRIAEEAADYSWCEAGGIIARPDDQGLPAAIRIVETNF